MTSAGERYPCTVSIEERVKYGRYDKYVSKGGSGYLQESAIGEKHLRVIKLNENGAWVETKHPIPKRTRLTVTIDTASTDSIVAIAHVASLRKIKKKEAQEDEVSFLVGLAFRHIAASDHRRLRKFLHVLDRSSKQIQP